MVDTADWDRVSVYQWHLHKGYAARNGPKVWGVRTRTIFLHRVIADAEDPKLVVDHINGNRLDNRRQNLRVVSVQQNNFNRGANRNKRSSQFKGVFWSGNRQLWFSMIKLGGKSTHLGYFETELDAAIAYNSNAIKLFGEHAYLNRGIPVESDWWRRRVFLKDNSTGFRGVTRYRDGRWQARLTVNGKRLSLGYFSSPVEAAKAYNAAAIKFLGARALLNQIDKEDVAHVR